MLCCIVSHCFDAGIDPGSIPASTFTSLCVPYCEPSLTCTCTCILYVYLYLLRCYCGDTGTVCVHMYHSKSRVQSRMLELTVQYFTRDHHTWWHCSCRHLVAKMKWVFDQVMILDGNRKLRGEIIQKTLKAAEFLIKFIMKSRALYNQ